MTRTFLTVCIALFLCGNVFAQSKKQIEVAAAVEKLRKAMVDADSAALAASVGEELSYGHSGGSVEGKADFVKKIVSGQSDFVSIDLSNQTISISDKTAVVRHDLNGKTNDNGKQSDVHIHVLSVWQKQHGEWKLIARQAVKKQ